MKQSQNYYDDLMSKIKKAEQEKSEIKFDYSKEDSLTSELLSIESTTGPPDGNTFDFGLIPFSHLSATERSLLESTGMLDQSHAYRIDYQLPGNAKKIKKNKRVHLDMSTYDVEDSFLLSWVK